MSKNTGKSMERPGIYGCELLLGPYPAILSGLELTV